MKKLRYPILALIGVFTICCTGNHLIYNNGYRKVIEQKFNERKLLAVNRDSALFTVFKQNLSTQQSEALKFLLAFMPLNDLADYNGDYFLANVDVALSTRNTSEWGKDIPEEIFLHYVLPYRINNENPDSFRIIYHEELMERIKGKDIIDAALEINYWCQEKVSYQPADSRTSGPVSTILSARGRCGEESTLAVAALRTVGIPARQVYTPRWAHTDDNHAWVEIWSNGDWHYMGACEPEPVPDRGWFTEPARRAMLVHTKSFGAFQGNENVINRMANFTDVNNLGKYATSKKITVRVTDQANNPVKNAKVEYQLYNYAEFYPLAVVPTDSSGISQFETGLGDLLIWAHKNDDFNFEKIAVTESDTILMKLNEVVKNGDSFDMDLDVPVVHSPLPGPPQDLIDQNSDRIKNGNLIRQTYIDSWMRPSYAKKLALSLGIDTSRLVNLITRSMGNYNEISSFLTETADSLRPLAISLLECLPEKDMRDIKLNTLRDHLQNTVMVSGDKYFTDYVLNPRVANEQLVSWRHYFLSKLPQDLIKRASYNPLLIVQYLNDNIKIAEGENYYNTPLTPIGVNELKVSDVASRAICFVAICRSLGITSRLEPGRNIPQFYFNNAWNDVYFSGQKKPDSNKAYLRLHSLDTKPVPEYYIQFTLARFEDGRYNTLEYDFNKKITDFREELPLPAGHYMLVTGNRLVDGKILSNISFFDLSENEHKTIEVNIRKDPANKKILGKIDLEKLYNITGLAHLSQSCTKHGGQVILWIEPDDEPSRHILNDIPNLKSEFDAWGGNFLFLTDSPYTPENSAGLPANLSFAIDSKLTALQNFVTFNSPVEFTRPCVILTDKNGNIIFISTGYRIGIGEQILKSIR